MDLVLTVEKGPPDGTPPGTSRTVDARGLSVGRATQGRSESNKWALKSVEGDGLSRQHCRIVFQGGVYSAIDTNSSFGLYLNGQRLASEEPAPLRDGDRLRLGEYELLVHLENGQPLAPSGGPLPDIIPDVSPFEWPEEAPSRGAIPEHIMEAGAPMRDDAPPENAYFEPPRVISRIPEGPIPDMSIPDARAPEGAIPERWWESESPAAPSDPLPPPQPIPPLPAEEFLPIPPAMPLSPVQPIPPRAPARETRAPSPVAVPPAGGIDGLTAFLNGARLTRRQLPLADANAALRAAGETFRVAVEGVRDILASRKEVKEVIGVEKTQISANKNNPLKFSASTEEALATMIAGNRAGFLSGEAAMREALNDIKVHEMALVAAIQVALKRLLEQIDPESLKGRIDSRPLWDVFPGSREARIWKIYEAKYAEIARELEEDFNGTFGRAFAEAYEHYIRRR